MKVVWCVIVSVGYCIIQAMLFPQLPPDANLIQWTEAGVWALYVAVVTGVPVIVISLGVMTLPLPASKDKPSNRDYPPRT